MAPLPSSCRPMATPASRSAIGIFGSDRCKPPPEEMKNIKGIIFDLDGTLADTLPLCVQAFRQSIEPLTSTPLTDAEIIATFGPSEEGTIMALAPDFYQKGVIDYLHLYETMHHMCPEPDEVFYTVQDFAAWLAPLIPRV